MSASSHRQDDRAPTTVRPGDLAPALAGALARRRIDRRLAVATLLGLIARGAVQLESAGRREPRVRLIDRGRIGPEGHEAAIWDELAARADADGVIDSRGLAWALTSWTKVEAALRRDLEARGWYHPDPDGRRRPYRIGVVVALAIAAVCFAAWIFAGQAAGLPAGLAFALIATGARFLGNRLPETTAAGETAAKPWRAYRAGLAALGRDDPDALKDDDTLPYAFALLDDDVLRRTGSPLPAVGEARPALGRSGIGWEFTPFWIAYAFEHQITASSAHHGGGIGLGAGGYDGGYGGGGSYGGGDSGGSY